MSTAPNPSQASLDRMLHAADRVRVIEGGVDEDRPIGTQVLLETAQPDDIALLRGCLQIVENPASIRHCMCMGDQAVEFLRNEERLGTIGLHHGESIRWRAWRHDARLKDGMPLLDWLAERGAVGPRASFQQAQHERELREAAHRQWRAAMPSRLASFEQDPDFGPVDITGMLAVLEARFPDPSERAMILFSWHGHGQSLWNRYPSYEQIPVTLLLHFPTQVLIEALQRGTVTEAHLEGAARFFAGWEFAQQRPDDLRLLPKELKRRLLEHALKSLDEDKQKDARKTFTSD